MKKYLWAALALVLACGLLWAKLQWDVAAIRVSESELLEELAARLDVPEDYQLKQLALVEGKDAVLLWAGVEERDGLYYAAEFARVDEAFVFSYDLSRRLREDGWAAFHLSWKNGYVFLCENPKYTRLVLRFPETALEPLELPLDGQPFGYYLDVYELGAEHNLNGATLSVEYEFLEG